MESKKEDETADKSPNSSPKNNSNESFASAIQNVLKQRYTSVTNIAKSGAFQVGGASLLWFMGYFNFSWLWIVIFVSIMVYMSETKKRRQTSALIAKRTNDNPKDFVLAMTEVYRMSAKDLPSWIYYPDVEKAEWVNNIIQKLWPFIGDFAKNLLTNEIQTLIRQSSSLLSEFAFTEVDLGQRAPQVAGIKVHGDEHTRKDEIIIDMQIVYEGDCNIGVGVSFLEAGIRDIRLRGLMRVELKPLLDTLPLVGAVSVSFVKDPTIDFDLTELANILDIPGFSHLLRCAIADSVGAMFVLPEKYIVKLSPSVDISRLRFPLPKGLVRIHIIEAENLAEKDTKIFGIGGKSDPYVVVKVGYQSKFKTKTIEHSLNPKWNEKFDALVRDVEYGNITFDVYDDDGALNKADFLGKITVSVKKVFERGIIDERIKLMDTTTGSLRVKLEWFDLTAEPKIVQKVLEESESEAKENRALLTIYVDKATNLPNKPNDSYNPSPYLKITSTSGEILKTKTVSHDSNPVWEENFRILLRQPKLDLVLFELKDKTYRKASFWFPKSASMRKASYKIKDERDDSNVIGQMKFAANDLVDKDEMMVDEEFPLEYSSEKARLKLRMSLRVFELKETSDSPSEANTFAVSAGPRLAANLQPKEEPKTSESATSPPKHSRSASNGSLSSNDNPETPTEGRSFAVDNLRRRLNAKKNSDLPPENNVKIEPVLGRIRLTIRYHDDALLVHVLNAENLIICDEDDQTSDPYVKVYVKTSDQKKHRQKTKVVKNSLNPTFDEELEFAISLQEASHSWLNVSVKNQTGFLSWEKTLMGDVHINLNELDLTRPTTKWYDLDLPEES